MREGAGDLPAVAVGFYVVPSFDMGEHAEGVDDGLDFGGFFGFVVGWGEGRMVMMN